MTHYDDDDDIDHDDNQQINLNDNDSYLSRSHNIFGGVNGETQNVVRMTKVKPLGVSVSIVNDSNGRNVVHNLSILQVEEIIMAVITTVP